MGFGEAEGAVDGGYVDVLATWDFGVLFVEDALAAWKLGEEDGAGNVALTILALPSPTVNAVTVPGGQSAGGTSGIQ